MANAFIMKRNDTLKPLERTLRNADGSAIDLTGATVRFHMLALWTKQLKVDALVTIVSAPDGDVKYDWEAADVDTAGVYHGEFGVTFPDGSTITVPNDSNIPITILEDIA